MPNGINSIEFEESGSKREPIRSILPSIRFMTQKRTVTIPMRLASAKKWRIPQVIFCSGKNRSVVTDTFRAARLRIDIRCIAFFRVALVESFFRESVETIPDTVINTSTTLYQMICQNPSIYAGTA